MIVDKLDNIMFYNSLVKNLSAGIEVVKALKILDIGRYEFDGGYFMIQKGSTKPIEEGTFEAHRKYVDVQIIVEGSEEVAWADICDLTTVSEYSIEKDSERFKGDFSHNIKISSGMFYMAFPHDGHKPVCHTDAKQSFTKIVMKLPV